LSHFSIRKKILDHERVNHLESFFAMKPKTILITLILIPLISGCIPDDGVNTLEGSWSCQETSEIFMSNMKGTSIFPVYFAQDIADNQTYYIDNFYQLGTGVEVKVKLSGGVITVEKQKVDGIEFEGSGTVNPSYELINLSYTADDGGGQVDHVTAVYSR